MDACCIGLALLLTAVVVASLALDWHLRRRPRH
jgi:hypothetical protein